MSAVEAFHPGRAPWAIGDDPHATRTYPEPSHPYRTPLQRDRDRIIHCSAFRRLDFKTQVFVPHEHDHFRTRLTHTIEVAQTARTLTRALGGNEDLAEAVALAHDLGHPPFGHAGEAALDALMAETGRFEHNRQSLRIVDYLEHPYPEFRGLNLTSVVRECIAKHETRYDIPICEDFDTARPAPLEGQLVDLADEIAYTAADTEDALQARWISREQLAGLALWRAAWDRVEARWPEARQIHKEIRAAKTLLAVMSDDAVATTAERIEAMGLDSPAAVRAAPHRAAGFSEKMARDVDRMQAFLLENVYTRGENARREDEAKRVLTDLFAAYTSDPSRLPDRYARRIDEQGLARVVCDYLAGMTDRFCLARHAEIPGA
jgi:dGTPase